MQIPSFSAIRRKITKTIGETVNLLKTSEERGWALQRNEATNPNRTATTEALHAA